MGYRRAVGGWGWRVGCAELPADLLSELHRHHQGRGLHDPHRRPGLQSARSMPRSPPTFRNTTSAGSTYSARDISLTAGQASMQGHKGGSWTLVVGKVSSAQ